MGRLLAALLLLVGIWSSAVRAQDDDGRASEGKAAVSDESRAERWRNVLKGKVPAGEQMPAPQPPSAADLSDPQTHEAYRAALREYYTYLQKGLQHRQRVFAWQHFSSITIFVVVILLVGAGVYFAAVQFHHGLSQAGGGTASQFEAGPSGLKVSSPVLGVIILAISLVFFYLYLVYVYPIQEIF